MFVIFVIFIGFCFLGWQCGKLTHKFLSPKDSNLIESSQEDKIIINNHTTNNHLHITEKQLKNLKR